MNFVFFLDLKIKKRSMINASWWLTLATYFYMITSIINNNSKLCNRKNNKQNLISYRSVISFHRYLKFCSFDISWWYSIIKTIYHHQLIYQDFNNLKMKRFCFLLHGLIFGVVIENMMARYLLIDLDEGQQIGKQSGNAIHK